MNNAIRLSRICLVGLLLFSPEINAQSCTPSTTGASTDLSPCYARFEVYTNLKNVTYSIEFPDGANTTLKNYGTGRCAIGADCYGNPYQETDCWAYFDDPVTSDSWWSQTVTDAMTESTATACPLWPIFGREYSYSPYCTTAGSIRTQVIQHDCTSGGGGNGGECVSNAGKSCAQDACGEACGTLSCDGSSCDESDCSATCCSGDTGTTGCWTDSCGNPCGAVTCNGSCDYSDCDNSCGGGGGGGSGDPCADCAYECLDFFGMYECEDYGDPVLIDLSGDGFLMTSAQNGVAFDFFGTGKSVRISWTAPTVRNGWLALDRNGNGKIDNGQELFGNATFQPGAAAQRLGFKALAIYDTPQFGGNGDGVISGKDFIFSKLRVWVDMNHNGLTEPGELITLQQAGIQSISLDYHDAHYTDAEGNQFRYRARVSFTDQKLNAKDHWAYDVILLSSDLPIAKGGK